MPLSVTAKVNSRFAVAGRLPRSDAHRHLPPGGELDGVADQVDEDLPQPHLVADHRIRHLVRHADGEIESLAPHFGSDDIDRLSEAPPWRERFCFDAELSRLELGHIKDIVQNPQEGAGRTLGRFQILPQQRGEVFFQGEMEHAEDAGHRRAQFVAHVDEELVL